ncbi:MAG: lytic transglycosylase domain-containing protein [Betaproteobacteria bacterium]|nr:lytic transglycosylase domain-containing protein [Betaproteobacteria bacterium]
MDLAGKPTIAPMLRALMLAFALAALVVQAAPSRPQTQDEIFLAAHAAARAGDYDKLARYEAQLQGYLLEPYVESWLLRARLEDASADEVRAFLGREQGSLLAEQMRKEWLKALGKKQQWDLFRAEHPLLIGEDNDVACYALQARRHQRDESALAEVRAQWYAPRELPEGCVPLAEALIADGQFTSRHVWERIRILLEAGAVSAAWRTAAYLPAKEALDRGQLFSVAAGPQRYLDDKKKNLSRRQARELAMFALHRLARSDPLAAAGYWDKQLRAKFSAEEQGYVWGQLALHAARRNLPEALKWYVEAGDAPLAEEQLAWRMRASLRQGNWNEIKVTAEKMPPLQRNEPAWIYWQGRADLALGNATEARTLFARIAGEHHFYARLAAEELGLAFNIPPKGHTPAPEEVAAIARSPGFRRALALYRLDQRFESAREWIWSIRGMDDKQLLAAAEFARQNEMFDRAINTADKTLALHDFSVRYLAPHRGALGGHARARQLEEAWVLGLVRQESRFAPTVKSSAGAAGLMQLMPATAKWVARRMGMRDYSWARVTDTEVNAALGTYYLRHVLDDLDGNPLLAAAAYNAGPGRARRWRDTRPLEGAIYAETIPFNETRDYVKKVMNNTMYYAAILGGQARSLKMRLGIIAPRGGNDKLMAKRAAEEEQPQ